MESRKKATKENTQLNPIQVDPRVYIRDLYCMLFHKETALAYIATQDYDTGFKTYGRIEVIEFLAFGVGGFNHFEFRDNEEKRYFNWLKNLKKV